MTSQEASWGFKELWGPSAFSILVGFIFIYRPTSSWSSPELRYCTRIKCLRLISSPVFQSSPSAPPPPPPPPHPLSAKLSCFLYQMEKIVSSCWNLTCLSRLWWPIKRIVCRSKRGAGSEISVCLLELFCLNSSMNKYKRCTRSC